MNDADFDGIPNFADCKPYDRKRDSTIIPASMQALRPNIPLTLAQTKELKQPLSTPEQETISIEDEKNKLYEQAKSKINQSIKDIDDRINAEQKSIENFTDNLKTETSPQGRQALVQNIRLSEQEIGNLNKQKQAYQTNLTSDKDELINRYYSGYIEKYAQERYEERRKDEIAEREAKKEYESKLKNIGLKPVYSNNKLTGYEDIKEGKSLGVNQIENYLKEREYKKTITNIPQNINGLTKGQDIFLSPDTKTSTLIHGYKGIIEESREVSLPFQIRGTQYYTRDKGYYTPTTKVESDKIPSFISFIPKAWKGIQEARSKAYGEVPKEVKEEDLFKLQTTYIPSKQKEFQLRGTLATTSSFLYKNIESEIGRERITKESISQIEYENIAKQDIQKIQDKYYNIIQDKINSGEISNQAKLDEEILKYTESMNKESDSRLNQINSQYKLDFESREKERIDKILDRKIKEEYWKRRTSDLKRAGTYLIPVIGTGLLAMDIAEFSYSLGKSGSYLSGITKKEPEMITSIKRMGTLGSIKEFVGAGLIYGGVGYGVGKYKSVKQSENIKFAIEQAEGYTLKSRGLITEQTLGKLKISESQKLELKKLLEQGKRVTTYDVELKAGKGLEDATPKIKGQFFEIADKNKNIIDRIGYGDIIAEFKGKTITGEALARGIAKIDENIGGIKGYTEIVTAERGRTSLIFPTNYIATKYKNLKLSKYLEDTRLIKYAQDKFKRKIETESTSSLISKDKFKKQKLMEEYPQQKGIRTFPDFENIKATPEQTIKFKEVQKARRKNVVKEGTFDIWKEGERYKELKILESEGTGISKFIRKLTKPKKAYKILKEEKDIKFKKEKGEKIKLKETLYEEKYPSYVTGGEGGAVSEFVFDKQFGQKGGMEVNRYDLARTESQGVLSSQMMSSFAGELSTSFSRINPTSFLGIAGAIKTKEEDRERISPMTISMNKLDLKVQQKVKEKLILGQMPSLSSRTMEEQQISPMTISKTLQATKQNLALKTKQTTKLAQPQLITPITITTTPKVPFTFTFPEEEEIKEEEKQAYNSEAYIDATKRNKAYWKRLNKKPLTKSSALGLSAEFVDKNISSRGRVIKAKGKPIDMKNKYYELNKFKFRTFQQKKGIKTKLPNSFIERQKFRLDNPGEKRQISKAKNVKSFFGF